MIVWLLLVFVLGHVCEASSDEEKVDILESIVEQQRVEGDELRARIRDLERRIADLKSARAKRFRDSLSAKQVPNNDEATGKELASTGRVIKRL